jgi:two-component system cell cycle sensor histidine kinase/response regulator CckA
LTRSEHSSNIPGVPPVADEFSHLLESGITTLLLLTGEFTDAAEPWRAEPAPESPGSFACGRRILVAEDDPLVSSLVERVLAEQGHQVHTAPHGEEALRLALHGPVDLLVTDVRMPVMDGWELSRRLRERWPDLPVLFISGYDIELTSAAGAPRRGAGAFLRKPFDPDELVRQVTLLLHQ